MNFEFEQVLAKLDIDDLQKVHEAMILLSKSRFLPVMRELQEQHLLTIARQAGGNPAMEPQLILESKMFSVFCNFIDGIQGLAIENET